MLRFAAAYGFRNIQNLVQKLKRGRCLYHYVEIMACPSGCLNGGGQVRSEDVTLSTAKEMLSQVEIVYNSVKLVCSLFFTPTIIIVLFLDHEDQKIILT